MTNRIRLECLKLVREHNRGSAQDVISEAKEYADFVMKKPKPKRVVTVKPTKRKKK